MHIADIQIKRKLRVTSVATHVLHKEHKQDVKVPRLIMLCDDTIEYSLKFLENYSMEPLNATPPAYQFLKIPPDLIWTRLSIWENLCLSNCTHSNVYYQ